MKKGVNHDHTPEFAAWQAEIELCRTPEGLFRVIEEVRVHPHYAEMASLIGMARLRAVLLGVDIHADRRFWITPGECLDIDNATKSQRDRERVIQTDLEAKLSRRTGRDDGGG